MCVQDISCNRHSSNKSAALYNIESNMQKAKKLTLPNSLLAIYQHAAQPALVTRCGICVMYVAANLNNMVRSSGYGSVPSIFKTVSNKRIREAVLVASATRQLRIQPYHTTTTVRLVFAIPGTI